ncbi:uncharacterized protein PFL1_06034 [Pseudozyma flocculosa PF-1]|uniref:DUF155 domain-containing protein n=1 Tax=Pseudozyma flocculosa PF-1 TaxID=1277687 RepID=A0A061H720_9BASI|nr:uncharacterized protein PFL1_06034 [Pseudozyma flocculosa PF-1]EPQ26386.1 hypothetical protein PFL1_06034 [Pseudozyma flocculosa PF-1]
MLPSLGARTPSKPLTKPVQISYAPSKSGSGGGSLTFNLPPHLITALKQQAPPSTKSAKSKAASASAAAKAARAAREDTSLDDTIANDDVVLPRRQPAAANRKHVSEVFAWATAYQYDFNALIRSGRLPPGWKWVERDEVIYVPSWPHHQQPDSSSAPQTAQPSASTSSAPTGEVFIFRSGSYITWNLSLSQSQRFLRQVIQGRDLQHVVELGRYTEMGDETMECLVDPSETTRIRDGLIVLGKSPVEADQDAQSSVSDAEPSSSSSSSSSPSSTAPPPTTSIDEEWTPLRAKLAFSQGLATSARLSVQEQTLSHFLASVSAIPHQLETTGRVPLTRAQVIRQMGTLLRLRQKANLDRDNFYDEPELYWDNAPMEDHFRGICAELDISSRFETFNDKLDHCENLLGVVRALLTESTTHRMEVIIIALIAFEAGIALLSHGWIPEWVVDAWRGVEELLGWSDADAAAAAMAIEQRGNEEKVNLAAAS